MKKLLLFGFLNLILSFNQANAQDWRNYLDHTNFKKYQEANEKLLPPAQSDIRVVFMGNSITEAWPVIRPGFFKKSNYVGRGISGQTTPQMLLRFRKDVINLQPRVVVLLAGINDIAGNTGYTPIELIAENIMSMTELAEQNNIKVVLCAVLPAIDFPWNTGLEPVNKIIKLNKIIKAYAAQNDIPYVDYHTAMKDDKNGLKVPEYTTADDLVHPNEAGYIVMEKLVQPAIDQALAASTLSVVSFFTDHMVLQQNENVAIWGSALSGNQVDVNGSWGKSATTTTDENGNWKLTLITPKAGGPYQINITSTNSIIQVKDVMIGEVWLASGQSNMSMPLKGWPPNDPIKNSKEEILNANYSNIRMFNVANRYSLDEENTFDGDWNICNPENAPDFSATAYFFARRLHQELNIPIGIIHSSWGGTPAEAWTSKKEINKLGDFEDVMKDMEDPDRKRLAIDWYSKWNNQPVPKEYDGYDHIDLGDLSLAQPEYNDENWPTMVLPERIDLYDDQDLDGVFWFRKTVNLSDISTDFNFTMGPVDDIDAVFFNGKKIGGTVNNYFDNRNYLIPKSLLSKGENTLAIRIIDLGGPGNIQNDIKLTNIKGQSISLKGDWKYQFTAELFNGKIYTFDEGKFDLSKRPRIINPSPYSTPSCLYNAMIHPLVPFNFKGAIWYQGESNVGRAEQYKRLFPIMINDWRTQWNANFPFYFVQIAPYKYNSSDDPNLDQSQKLRDAQRHTLSVDKTGMVVTLDIGNNTNIHPANKQAVGSRLADLALANDYGKKIVASGPLYKSHTIKRKKIILEFNSIGSGLLNRNSKLLGFEIAGSDKVFVPANAKIVGNKISVCAKEISKPKYVRYAWRDTSEASFFNKEGLPAASFTTEK